MAATKNSTTNASAKKPRGKPFTKDDPRRGAGFEARPEARNNNGQRNAAVVSFNREIRAIISEVGNEEVTSHGQKLTRIEGAVRGMYQAATKGNVQAFNALMERVEGKVSQTVEHDFSKLPNDQLIARAAELTANIAAIFNSVGSGAASAGDG